MVGRFGILLYNHKKVSKALPIISVSPFGANATIIPDIPIKTLKNKSMLLLSILPTTEVKNSAVIRAKTPDTDML
ncbi:hypothetical protein [Campylobacter hyointestinalis]|uniref:hypothetical protein n=1 Tax=Campylobacter hyointestinalis TaxID=198 RepID=UPI001C9C3BE3|nr:hypothetical protein [Campylobacter hyointestinalis]